MSSIARIGGAQNPATKKQIEVIMDDRKMSDNSHFPGLKSAGRQLVFAGLVATIAVLADCTVFGQQVFDIWSPRLQQSADDSPNGACFFRKKFTLIRPEKCEIEISVNDTFEMYINGRLASRGESYGTPMKFEAAELLQPGVNLIAVKAEHHSSQSPGLALRFRVKERGESRWRSLTTDDTWKTRINPPEAWKSNGYNDIGWLKAEKLGLAKIDRSAGADESQRQAHPAASEQESAIASQNVESGPQPVEQPKERFEISSDFTIQKVMKDSETGSLIKMAFNEFGKLILSQEGGPLLIADFSRPAGDPARVRVLCNEVNSCQGILPLNGTVYVTGEGPNGLGLYLLSDPDANGVLHVKDTLLTFTGELGEHGPHGIELGPDGMIYVVIGNASQIKNPAASSSPYRHYYEGDLVPRYEDPGGHAVGIKAPGGTIVRVSLDGSVVETVAGGLRNAYDLVFDDRGELFVHDSDMESDMGMAWYRPTMVFHVPHGAEFGWRSGWAKFPEHFIDMTPPVCKTGRGSPTGAVLYQHLQFPARYHNNIFLADWSEGRILAVKTYPTGAGFEAKQEVFLKGQPLNVVDLAVGEDGALYFCTGGRGTAGGVYRIVWKGQVPDQLLAFENNLARMIRHPQPDSAWARQNMALLKQQFGDEWAETIAGVAGETRNEPKYRLRALDAMLMHGPFPSTELLEQLSTDENAAVRAKVALLCGLRRGTASQELLGRLVKDGEPTVRRQACESFLRLGSVPSFESIQPMLKSTDRIEALAARRVLERIPVDQWRNQIFDTDDVRIFIQGSLALMVAKPDLPNAYEILARASRYMDGFVSDDDFVDMLRVIQITLVRGSVDGKKIPAFIDRIINEFPSGNGTLNSELARILAYLGAGDVDGRIAEYLQSDADSDVDKLQVAMLLQTIGANLNDSARMALIDYLEAAQSRTGGGSYKYYVRRAIRDIARSLSDEQVAEVLSNGSKWPVAAIGAFYKLPEKLDNEMVKTIVGLDQEISSRTDDASRQVRLGVIAVLARSGDEDSMAYLRQMWRDEEAMRADIAIGLAERPDGQNWAFLVSSLPILDDVAGIEVLQKLALVNRRPRNPAHFRNVISLGYRLRQEGAEQVDAVLRHWSGETIATGASDWQQMMNEWKNWYQKRWPEQPEITVEQQTKIGKYSVDQVLGYLEQNHASGNSEQGQIVYAKAQCANCHRHGLVGEVAGPDLTGVENRFSRREIVESLIHPSRVISDRYQSKKILTMDGNQFTGMVTQDGDGSYLVLQSDGQKVRIDEDDVDEIAAAETSAMPEGLLDELSLAEIADLFAYIYGDEKLRTADQQKEADVR